MWVTRITPRIILLGLTAHLSLRLVAWLFARFGPIATGETALEVIRVVGSLLAYALALLICWGVAEEYRGTKWMRLAWLALTVNAALSLLRPFARPLPFLTSAIDLYSTPPRYALFLHAVMVSANFCLLVGLLAIWWAYHKTGLGFGIKKRDGVAMIGLFVLMLAFFIFNDLLTEARAFYRTTRILQFIAQIQMFLIAAASLLLHRISMQMGSGRLAIVLRWMTIYALLRLGLVLSVSLARAFFPSHKPIITDVAEFGWQAAPWVFALAVAYRAEITALAAARLRHVEQQRAADRPAFTA